MAYQVSGQAPAPGSEGRRLKEVERAIAQLQRLMTAKQKIPKAAPGAGIVGQAQVFSNEGTVKAFAGLSSFEYSDVRYGAITDPSADGAGPSWITIDGSFPYKFRLDEGWYLPVLSFYMEWSSQAVAPQSVQPYMFGGPDVAHQDFMTIPTAYLGSGSAWGVQWFVNTGPTYIAEGGTLHAEGHLEPDPTADSVSGSVAWVITKLQ